MNNTYLSDIKPNESKLVRGDELQKTISKEYSDNKRIATILKEIYTNESNLNSMLHRGEIL